MSHRDHSTRGAWPAAEAAAKVGADPVRRVAQHVEGPTLLNREPEFGRGIATFDRAPTCSGRSSPASACAGPGHSFSRRLFARPALRTAATLAVFALLASGCGIGGGEEAAPVDTAATAAPLAPATDTAAPGTLSGAAPTAPGAAGATTSNDLPPGANEISTANASAGQAVTISAITPKEFTRAHCRKPILVVLYQPTSILDEALLREAKAAAASVEGTVTLVYTPKQTRKYGDLPSKLGLLSTPGVATVSRSGSIENFWTTFVDRALILKSLQNAAAGKSCKVSNDDAPAPGADLENAASLVSGGSAVGTTTPAAGVPTVDAAAGTGSADLLG